MDDTFPYRRIAAAVWLQAAQDARHLGEGRLPRGVMCGITGLRRRDLSWKRALMEAMREDLRVWLSEEGAYSRALWAALLGWTDDECERCTRRIRALLGE